MDVSFSLPEWKANQLQNIDLKLQSQFYASTKYNLDDFKLTSKTPIFTHYINNHKKEDDVSNNNNTHHSNNYVIKQLINQQNVSLGLFVAYLYQFIPRILKKSEEKYKEKDKYDKYDKQIYKNNNDDKNTMSILSNNNNLLKIQSKIKNRFSFDGNNNNIKDSYTNNIIDNYNKDNIYSKNNINSERRLILQNEYNNNQQTQTKQYQYQQYTQQQQYHSKDRYTDNLQPEPPQPLKLLKLKLYQLDLCILSDIPQQFLKYYHNNLLKKLIFQYLTKVLHNISLIEILLMNNEVLCFALSLISKVLYCGKNNKQNIQNNKDRMSYKKKLVFIQEVRCFLDCFDSVNEGNTNIHKYSSNNNNNSQKSQKKYQFFSLYQNQMRSKHVIFKQNNKNEYLLYLKKSQSVLGNNTNNNTNTDTQAIPNNNNTKIIPKLDLNTVHSSKTIPSSKTSVTRSTKHLKQPISSQQIKYPSKQSQKK